MSSQVTNHKCPACTGPLHFAGDSGKLECEYCGSSFEVEEIEALYAAKEETENELRKAKQKEKILQNQISKLTRNARTHRLCTRAGMLESFLPNPELLTDDEVMTVLKIAFHQPAMKSVLEKLAAESEARKTLTE